jgi:RHS repeat-associated protein
MPGQIRMSRSDDHRLNGTDVKGADGTLTTYSWDLENRVTGVALPASGLNTMVGACPEHQRRDGDGKRRSYADSVMLRSFLWDGENIARQTDVNNATNRNYTLDPQGYGELISQDGPAFHHGVYPERSRGDALGSTRNLTDGTQNVTDTRDYTAFGETNASSGTNLNRFWWLGKWGYYLQPDLGNVWVRARIEEPVDGRWKSRDPLVARARHYCIYVNNGPVALMDPSGLITWTNAPEASEDPCGSEVYTWGKTEPPPGCDDLTKCIRQRWPAYVAALHRKCDDCLALCEPVASRNSQTGPVINPPTSGEGLPGYMSPAGPNSPFASGQRAGQAGMGSLGRPPMTRPPWFPGGAGATVMPAYQSSLFQCQKGCVPRRYNDRTDDAPASQINAWDEVMRPCRKYMPASVWA